MGIFQTRILEQVVISFSRGSSQPRDQTQSPALQADSLLSHQGSMCLYLCVFVHWENVIQIEEKFSLKSLLFPRRSNSACQFYIDVLELSNKLSNVLFIYYFRVPPSQIYSMPQLGSLLRVSKGFRQVLAEVVESSEAESSHLMELWQNLFPCCCTVHGSLLLQGQQER